VAGCAVEEAGEGNELRTIFTFASKNWQPISGESHKQLLREGLS
jgi:hypothetical protein